MTYTFGDNAGIAATVESNRPVPAVTAATSGGTSGGAGGFFDGVRLLRRGGANRTSTSSRTVRRHR